MGFKDKVKAVSGFYNGFVGTCIAPGETKVLVRFILCTMTNSHIDAWLLPEELLVVKDA